MASKLPGYEETVVCPYNKCHIILKHRFQTHLVKCARANPHIILNTCPFDITHRYPADQEAAHIEECESRGNFDRYQYRVEDDIAPKPAPSQSVKRAPRARSQFGEEDWDHFNVPTYDPKKYAETSKVLRQSGLMTPSERRQFAADERKRIQDLENGGSSYRD